MPANRSLSGTGKRTSLLLALALVVSRPYACRSVDGAQLEARGNDIGSADATPPHERTPTRGLTERAPQMALEGSETARASDSDAQDAAVPLLADSPPLLSAEWDRYIALSPAPAVAPFEARCGRGALTRGGAAALQRAPYLQNLDSDSVTVVYKLEPAAALDAEVLELSTEGGDLVVTVPVQIDESAPDGQQRVARASGLSPDTYYCYELPGLTERIGFRTAPAADVSSLPTRFIAIGDSGTGSSEQAAVRDRFATLEFDFLLHAGDIAYADGTLEQFERHYFDVYSSLLKSIASFPVPGNHEYRTDDAAPFVEVFELPDNGIASARDRWFSFDWGNVHFVGLDTQQVHAEQVEWLERDLANNQLPWVVAYLHRPPFSSGVHGGAEDVLEAFVPLFERHRVALVLSGHDHHYERTVLINGVTYVVTGGGGRGLRRTGASPFTAHSESAFHFVSVVIDDRAIDLRAIDPSGREIDAVQITR